ncbi:MAG TPA: hypothetical protein VF541_10590 [Longimicrobium sp.]|jgi:hypothetical protein
MRMYATPPASRRVSKAASWSNEVSGARGSRVSRTVSTRPAVPVSSVTAVPGRPRSAVDAARTRRSAGRSADLPVAASYAASSSSAVFPSIRRTTVPGRTPARIAAEPESTAVTRYPSSDQASCIPTLPCSDAGGRGGETRKCVWRSSPTIAPSRRWNASAPSVARARSR